MRLSIQQLIEHEQRISRKRNPLPASSSPPAERETGPNGLHQQIIDWCGKQWPRWKYRYSRPDKKTTEEIGVEDFTIFAPAGQVIHVECKARTEKPSEAQLIWAKELEMLGHKVYFVWSFVEFEVAVLEATSGITRSGLAVEVPLGS